MKKKILFSFIFIFISLFFTINVKGATASGSTAYNPIQPSSFPNFITDKVYYDNVRDVLFNDILSGLNQSTQDWIGSSSEYQYMYSYFNYENGRANRQVVVFMTDIPTWSYNSTYNGYVFTLPTGSKYARFQRSYYSDWGRFENSFAFGNEFNSNNIGPRLVTNSTFSGTGYILNTNNFTLDSSLLSYLTNISSDNKIILDFNYQQYKYFNYFYLDDTLVYTNACGEDDLTVGRFYSCPFNSDTPIESNKVVSIMRLSQSYMPNGWDYNNLGWSDTTDKYYNSMIGGIFPQNSKIEEISFVSSSDSSVLLTSNILDVQYTDINSPTYHFNLFSSAISWNDTTLSNYDLIKTTISFPTTDITSFDVWEEGFNKLSDNYIADNISTTNNAIQEQILGNLNGNTVSTDNYFNFFNNFQVNNHSLSGFITLPLQTISHLSDTCSVISVPFPMMPNFSFTLPCMSAIYSQYLGNFFTMYQLIINGVISYYVGIGLFKIVKNTHDPKNDSIEVVDL